ncbi:hypothetical protein J7E62_28590 [Variovorax paradoxus]|nr:hypothetical protein [Variovorax paradoxus]
MKTLILSDPHLEFWHTFVRRTEGHGIAIIAGDISARAVYWAKRPSTSPGAKGVTYVPGDHVFYGGVIQPVTARIKHAAEGTPASTTASATVGGVEPARLPVFEPATGERAVRSSARSRGVMCTPLIFKDGCMRSSSYGD